MSALVKGVWPLHPSVTEVWLLLQVKEAWPLDPPVPMMEVWLVYLSVSVMKVWPPHRSVSAIEAWFVYLSFQVIEVWPLNLSIPVMAFIYIITWSLYQQPSRQSEHKEMETYLGSDGTSLLMWESVSMF